MCGVKCVLCIVYCVWCVVHCVLRIVYNVVEIVYRVLRFVCCDSCFVRSVLCVGFCGLGLCFVGCVWYTV